MSRQPAGSLIYSRIVCQVIANNGRNGVYKDVSSHGICWIMYSIDEWKSMWTRGVTPWHINHVDKMLEKYLDLFTGGKSGLSIFVPLCGKSLDLMWLADKGYKVFGVDVSEQAVSEIFQEAGVSAKVTLVGNDSKLYEGCGGRVKVIAGDVFSLNRDICGQFDCIWSKHSFGSINLGDRDKYVNLISSLLKPHGKILLCTLFYERADRAGPPFPTSTGLIKSYYGKYFEVEFLKSVDWTKPEVVRDLKAISDVEQAYHFLRKID